METFFNGWKNKHIIRPLLIQFFWMSCYKDNQLGNLLEKYKIDGVIKKYKVDNAGMDLLDFEWD